MLLDIGRATPACGFLNLDLASDIAPGATQLVMRRAVPRRAAPRSNAPRPHRSAHSELILRLIATL